MDEKSNVLLNNIYCYCCGAPWLKTVWGKRRVCIKCYGFKSYQQLLAAVHHTMFPSGGLG